jgi:hypothetical protein
MLHAFDALYRTELARAGLQIPAATAEGISAERDRATHA